MQVNCYNVWVLSQNNYRYCKKKMRFGQKSFLIIVVIPGFQVTVEFSDQCAFKNEEFQW